MHHRLAAIALALLGGCHQLFGLTEVDVPVGDARRPDSSPPALSPWAATTELPVGRDYNHAHAAFVSGTVFMIGGYDVVELRETEVVYRAVAKSAGLEGWTTTTALPAPRALGDVVTVGDRIYVVGGANGGGAQSTVYYGDVTSSGDITSWTATTPLPAAIKAHAAAEANGYLYVFGGGDVINTRLSSVYSARIMPSGALGPWEPTTPLPGPRANLAGFAARGFLYAIGGDADLQEQPTATAYVASLDRDTGAVLEWSETTSLPMPKKNLVAVTDSDYVYLLGGMGQAPSADVLYARILDDGAIGPWEMTEPLLLPRTRHAAVLADGQLFVIGGAGTATSVERSSRLVQ